MEGCGGTNGAAAADYDYGCVCAEGGHGGRNVVGWIEAEVVSFLGC